MLRTYILKNFPPNPAKAGTGEEEGVTRCICVKYKAQQAQFSNFTGKMLLIHMKVALRHQGYNIPGEKAL